MTASIKTVDSIVHILLKYVDLKTARKIARDMYSHVDGNKSVTDTFRLITERLIEMD